MGLTRTSTGKSTEDFDRKNEDEKRTVIALAGNPNVGKSTVFNALTGLRQHTGNWTGKTVANASGTFMHNENEYIMVDIPGTYSLHSSSSEETVARNFICFGGACATVVVLDATCLERNLNLALQIIETGTPVILCVNLIDEAQKKGIIIDFDELSLQLGCEVVPTAARSGTGLDVLKDTIEAVSECNSKPPQRDVTYSQAIEKALDIIIPVLKSKSIQSGLRFIALRLLDADNDFISEISKNFGFDALTDTDIAKALQDAWRVLNEFAVTPSILRDEIVSSLVKRAEEIAGHCVRHMNDEYNRTDRKLDKLFTSKKTGIPIMLALLGIVFWITIVGANYPSQMLSELFGHLGTKFEAFLQHINTPDKLQSLVYDGVYTTVAWVVAVMLPPMAIFFPMFTLLEDFGYLPRVAFNLDSFFRKAGAHGKQSLTMCMGFGCNACGVIGCRIIDSPRERLIAIITNTFVPCNGRFPTLIALITMFFTMGFAFSAVASALSALLLLAIIVFSVFVTLMISKLLSKTLLKGLPSSFALELPPYRPPQLVKTITRSIFDRTLFVLGRAITVALPAGAIIWLFSNISVGDSTLLVTVSDFLDPFASFIGLDGIILLAFILGFPANEIVLPIIIMGYMATGKLTEISDLTVLKTLLTDNGWTVSTAICVMLFSLMHFPCSTTCLTIYKETKSIKWTAMSFLIPTAVGITVCAIVANALKLII